MGQVGAVQPAAEIKLQSVPEMKYFVEADAGPKECTPSSGEILLAGANVTQHGYFKDDDKTAEDFILHDDGKIWFHTGDIGVMLKDGNLKIVDRKKDLIKLSGGEFASLGKVEAILKGVKGIGACIVFAQSDKANCVCIVSQPEKGWGSVGGKPVEKELLESLTAYCRQQKLFKFEIPTKVKVDDTIWTPESGHVTAALKLSRTSLRELYNAKDGLLEKMEYSFPGA